MHLRAPALTCLLLACAGVAAAGQMSVATGRDTLRGLPGVEVAVEPLPPELTRAGLSAVGIRAAVVDRLEAAGITVYPSQAANPSPAKAYVYVHLNALALPRQDLVTVAVLVQVRQAVDSLASESRIVDAVTWDAHNVVAAAAAALPALEDEILGYVDLFVEDWQAVH